MIKFYLKRETGGGRERERERERERTMVGPIKNILLERMKVGLV